MYETVNMNNDSNCKAVTKVNANRELKINTTVVALRRCKLQVAKRVSDTKQLEEKQTKQQTQRFIVR